MLSLAMIVRDEADGIGGVLDAAAKFCDELVVMDTGSRDDTVAVARAHGADVHQMVWPDSFAKARNAARDATRGEWVIHLDGHDYLPPESIEGFTALKPELDSLVSHDAVVTPMCIVNTAGTPLLSFPRERITRRHLEWTNDAHTIISPQQPTWRPYQVHTLQRMGDKPKRALGVLKERYDSGDRSPRTVFYYARESFWAGDYSTAIPLYCEWLDMQPCHWEKYSGLIDLGAAFEQVGNPNDAVVSWLAAIDVAPSRAEAYAAMGNFLVARGEYKLASDFYEQAAHAERPREGFVVETWYSDRPRILARKYRAMAT